MIAYDISTIYSHKFICDSSKFAIGRARVPATCGELMQGNLAGIDFLINSPISLFAEVKVTLTENGLITILTPGTFTKVKKAIRATLNEAGHNEKGAIVEVLAAIPRGKGLASSTAEITAAICATATALRKKPWKTDYTKLVLDIDRSTDSVYQPGIVNCSFLTGGVIESFPTVPSLAFVVVDNGGEVETGSFDRDHARAVSRKHGVRLLNALKGIRLGFKKNDSKLIAKAATESAIINQEVLHKRYLDLLLNGTSEFGSLGVNCAHTGTVLGVLFNPHETERVTLTERVERLVGKENIFGVFNLISGGMSTC